MIYYYLILFLIAFVSTWWIFKKVLKVAIVKNIVDNPGARKLQKVPTPLLGGIAAFFGVITAMTTAGLFCEEPSLYVVMGILVIMVYIGTLDDIISLSPFVRFSFEILVILLLIYCNHYSLNDFHGLWGIGMIPDYIAVPLTVFVCVGIINAINLIDGVNGLCSGFCIMASMVFGGVFIWSNDTVTASLAVLSLGALIPFFLHNVFGLKSKMFLGDGGSLLMGTIMSIFVLGALNADSSFAEKVDPNFGLIPFAIATLAIPVFDTIRVMTLRIMRGRSPFSPDKTHLHHLFFSMGFSHIGTTASILFLNLIVILGWYVSYMSGFSIDVQLYVVILLGVMVTFVLYGVVGLIRRKNEKLFNRLQNFGKMTHIGHTDMFGKLRNFLDRGCDNIKSEIN